MKERTGTVFDIQRYSIHDGPGIRTVVFLKGCPLHCRWCANPESQDISHSLFYTGKHCVSCGCCTAVCPSGAISLTPKSQGVLIDRGQCRLCFRCTAVCPSGALQCKGAQMTVSAVLREATRDQVFFAQSGGGVTLSGGEPLFQHEFVLDILKELKARNIHTALETTGVGEWDALESILRYTDVVLFDFKHINPTVFHQNIGTIDILKLYEKMVQLYHAHNNIVVRIPIIPGFNDDPESINQMIAFLKDNCIHKVELLKFHQLGASKYGALGLPYCYQNVSILTEERFHAILKQYKEAGLSD